MKRFLFVIVDGGGNVPAQVAVARRLAARGHEVHVLGDPGVQSAAREAACRFHPFVDAPRYSNRDRHTDPVRDWEPRSPLAQVRRVGERVMFGPAAAYARDVLATVERLRPDAIAVDCLPFGAIVGAEKSGVPSAVLLHFPMHAPARGVTPFGLGLKPARGPIGRLRDDVLRAVMRRLLAYGLEPVNAARRELGLPPIEDVMAQLLRLNRSLVLTSAEFDFVPEGLPSHVRYVGPQLDDPAEAGALEDASLSRSGEPQVLVSLGTTYQRQEQTFSRAVDALGLLPVRGLATFGAIDPPARVAPPNVTVVRSVPHRLALPLASAIICHGGLGTVMKALAHGLPLVVLPLGRDQKDNAARVEACGAGVRLSRSASPRRIADAVRRVMGEPHFRESAQRMAAFIARDVREDRAVVEMEALASVTSR
jgi:MGT family glycosyltransferase